LKFDQSKCLHYYFYFIDKELDLCYLRVPTWIPLRLQFYINGHNLLAHKQQVKETYKYFPTAYSKEIIAAGLAVRNLLLVPALA